MSMSAFLKAGWIGLASTLVVVSGAAVQTATAADALAQGTPFADGSVEAGTLKATTCSACHGPSGNSTTAQWPKIAGQNAVYQFFWGEFCDWYLELAKLRLDFVFAKNDETALTLDALVTVFEAALRLLSPFMPFLTEELWHALHTQLGIEPPSK